MTADPLEHPGGVVVGVDGSDCSAKALDWALHYAAAVGLPVTAVISWEWPAANASLVDMPYIDLAEPTTHALQAAVDAALDRLSGPDHPTVTTRVVEGHPAHALIEAAAGADLLVVGSRGHGTLSGLLLGSTGLYCAAHAPCPVVVVRPTGETRRHGDG